MNVLVIGGNRFMGLALVWRLLHAGHRVTVLNRGLLGDPFGDRVDRIRVDRSTDDFERRLAGMTFDRVIDFAAFSADDAAHAIRAFSGRTGHYVLVSTGQVYLVREGCPRPSREDDYAGPVMAQPPTPADDDDWAYGIGKRGAEDTIAAAPDLPSTRLRIPMVNGENDDKRRIESYLWRLLDGGPILVPSAGAIARHVYSGAVVRAIGKLIEAPPPPGQAFNLAQPEQPTVRELVERIARRAGGRAQVIDVPRDVVEDAGLSVRAASPFSSRWMSLIDPGRAVDTLGFEHPPLDVYLDSILANLHAAWPGEPPPGYAQRAGELALARA
jgi:nucleoside-diphosphate-sugar epimerase